MSPGHCGPGNEWFSRFDVLRVPLLRLRQPLSPPAMIECSKSQ